MKGQNPINKILTFAWLHNLACAFRTGQSVRQIVQLLLGYKGNASTSGNGTLIVSDERRRSTRYRLSSFASSEEGRKKKRKKSVALK